MSVMVAETYILFISWNWWELDYYQRYVYHNQFVGGVRADALDVLCEKARKST